MSNQPTSVVLRGPDGPIHLRPPAFIEPSEIFKKVFGFEPSDLSEIARKDDVRYGLQQDGVNPFKLAERREPTSGAIFFGQCKQEDFVALLRLLDFRIDTRYYWVFAPGLTRPQRMATWNRSG